MREEPPPRRHKAKASAKKGASTRRAKKSAAKRPRRGMKLRLDAYTARKAKATWERLGIPYVEEADGTLYTTGPRRRRKAARKAAGAKPKGAKTMAAKRRKKAAKPGAQKRTRSYMRVTGVVRATRSRRGARVNPSIPDALKSVGFGLGAAIASFAAAKVADKVPSTWGKVAAAAAGAIVGGVALGSFSPAAGTFMGAVLGSQALSLGAIALSSGSGATRGVYPAMGGVQAPALNGIQAPDIGAIPSPRAFAEANRMSDLSARHLGMLVNGG